MPKFELLPCKTRDGKFVPQKDAEPFELDMKELLKRFGMDPPSHLDLSKIQTLRPNAFVGLSKSKNTGKPVCFVLLNTDRSPNFEWLLQKDPSFERRILEVYRVESAHWEGVLEEVAA